MMFRVCVLTFFAICLVVFCESGAVNRRDKRENNSKANNEEFEKFFLKASKSVPRIGRRGSSNDFYSSRKGEENLSLLGYPFMRAPKRSAPKGIDASIWADIDTFYEYNPELPSILEYLSGLPRDSAEYDAISTKLKNFANKELLEYRMQEEV